MVAKFSSKTMDALQVTCYQVPEDLAVRDMCKPSISGDSSSERFDIPLEEIGAKTLSGAEINKGDQYLIRVAAQC
jgi:hypothetical protein